MRRLNLLPILGIIVGTSVLHSQNIGINATGAVPDNSAGLDVNFSNKGLLIPRVGLTSSTDAATIPSPATSLLVYNTGTGGLTPAGYYYNAGTPGSPNWVRLMPATGVLSICGGALNNYVQKWTGSQLCNSIIFDNGTNVGIGTAAPASKLHVTGEVYSTSGYNDIVYIGGDASGNDAEVGIQSATRNIITFYNRTQGISADVNMRDVLSARHITFNGALQPAGNPGTSGQILTSQGAGLPPVWQTPASIPLYGNNAQSVKLTSMVNTTSTSWVNIPGMSITMTPQHNKVFIFASVAARLTNNIGNAQLGQATMYIRVLVNGVEQAISKCILTDFDEDSFGGQWVVTGGSAAISGVPVNVTIGVPITVTLQWYISPLWATAPWQLRCDPTLANIGDHAVLTVFD
ncbi:MAG: hypothetical protein KatS3mg028_0718 [Bacteroidia bacterium]|nr:MAG: hypothetical protein KatS3mg028_0718 [Bacteroidia bacterium]